MDLDRLDASWMGHLDETAVQVDWACGRDVAYLIHGPGDYILLHPVAWDQILATDVFDRLRRVQATIEARAAARAAAALRKLDDAINSYDWLDHTDIDELLEDE